MKTLELTQGKVTFIDDDVYEWVSKFKWHARQVGNNFYAVRNGSRREGCTSKAVYLHREICPAPKGFITHHKNEESLDNRRENLVSVSRKQHEWLHYRRRGDTSSKFRGVHLYKLTGKWCSHIYLNSKNVNLGYFDSEADAAQAYAIAARENRKLSCP